MNPDASFYLGVLILFIALGFSFLTNRKPNTKKPMAVKCGYAPADQFPQIKGMK